MTMTSSPTGTLALTSSAGSPEKLSTARLPGCPGGHRRKAPTHHPP